jgi:hypothetical protein
MNLGTKPRTVIDPNLPYQDGGVNPYSDYYLLPKINAKE